MFGVLTEEVCPVCGSLVSVQPDCPGYTINNKIMVCNPNYSCGNAELFECLNEECGWWYREPNYRSDVDSMGMRPPWDMRQYNLSYLMRLSEGEDESTD